MRIKLTFGNAFSRYERRELEKAIKERLRARDIRTGRISSIPWLLIKSSVARNTSTIEITVKPTTSSLHHRGELASEVRRVVELVTCARVLSIHVT